VSPRARTAFLAIVGAQLLLPLGLIAYNEIKLATGTDVVLRTEPVDPRDLFRGRYVALRYSISNLPAPGARPGDVVYVPLYRVNGHWEGRGAFREPPDDDVTFVRGRFTGNGIEYGIESLFVDEDVAPELERAAGRQELYIDVVLDDDGRARIEDAHVVPRR